MNSTDLKMICRPSFTKKCLALYKQVHFKIITPTEATSMASTSVQATLLFDAGQDVSRLLQDGVGDREAFTGVVNGFTGALVFIAESMHN